jgi:hypothetical protein
MNMVFNNPILHLLFIDLLWSRCDDPTKFPPKYKDPYKCNGPPSKVATHLLCKKTKVTPDVTIQRLRYFGGAPIGEWLPCNKNVHAHDQ